MNQLGALVHVRFSLTNAVCVRSESGSVRLITDFDSELEEKRGLTNERSDVLDDELNLLCGAMGNTAKTRSCETIPLVMAQLVPPRGTLDHDRIKMLLATGGGHWINNDIDSAPQVLFGAIIPDHYFGLGSRIMQNSYHGLAETSVLTSSTTPLTFIPSPPSSHLISFTNLKPIFSYIATFGSILELSR